MPVPLPALIFSNPILSHPSFYVQTETDTFLLIQGRADSDKGVLPDDLLVMEVTGPTAFPSRVKPPVIADPKGDVGGEPWTLVAQAGYDSGFSPRIAVWARRVTLREARQTTRWRVPNFESGERGDTGLVTIARFAYGWYRWPMPWRFSTFAGVTSSSAYRWSPITTFDASADSIPDPGSPGQGLSTTLVFCSTPYNFSGTVVSPVVGAGWSGGATSGMDAQYCRHDGGVVPGGYVTGTGSAASGYGNERYVTMTMSIAPPPNVTFPVGDRPVRQIGQTFGQNLDGGAVFGAGTARIG